MPLYDANGNVWHPIYEETHVLDDVLRQIVDAIRYRRPRQDESDPYAKALVRLTEAVTDYTTALRRDPEAAGRVPQLTRRAG